MDTKIVKSGIPQKTVVPEKSSLPLRSESPQTAAVDGRQSRPASSPVPLLDAAAGLSLPKDALSAALLVFTRFFSLSADKALLGSLRREILDLLKTSSPGTAEEKAALEAKAMAAVIAADKGVVFSPSAMERYARFLMPAAFTQTPFMAPQSMPKTSNEKENPSSKTAAANHDSREKPLEEIPDADELKAIAETQTQEDGFLDFMNYLPGKNGRYWLVFPFDVIVKGIELRVFLRVLGSERRSVTGRPSAHKDGQMIADISGPKRQWRCFLKKNAGKFRADIRVYPECSPRMLTRLQKQAERFLGNLSPRSDRAEVPLRQGGGFAWSKNSENFSGFEEIIVRNGDRIPLWAEDLQLEYLPFVDEEV